MISNQTGWNVLRLRLGSWRKSGTPGPEAWVRSCIEASTGLSKRGHPLADPVSRANLSSPCCSDSYKKKREKGAKEKGARLELNVCRFFTEGRTRDRLNGRSQ